jgi:hypothetical protein
MPKQQAASSQPTNAIATLLSLVAERAPGTLGRGGERDLDGAAAFVLQRWREGKLGAGYGELDLGLYELPAEVPQGDTMLMEGEEGAEEQVEDPETRRERLMEELKQRADPALRIDALVRRHFQELARAERAGVGTSLGPARGAGRDSRRAERASDTPDDASLDDAASAGAEALMSRHQSKKRDKAQLLKRKNEKLAAKGIGARPPRGSAPGARLAAPRSAGAAAGAGVEKKAPAVKIPGRLRAAAAHGARRPLSALLKSKKMGMARSGPPSARSGAPAGAGKPKRTGGTKRTSMGGKPTRRR